MKHWIIALMFTLLAGCNTETPPASGPPSATPSESDSASASENSAADSDVIVIDVRSEEEWNSGHVEQAFHIPHTEIAQRISEATDDKDAKIVVYCAVGGRAGKAKSTLEELGFTNVENGGGYDDVKTRFK